MQEEALNEGVAYLAQYKESRRRGSLLGEGVKHKLSLLTCCMLCVPGQVLPLVSL